jgi:hypothetical protein
MATPFPVSVRVGAAPQAFVIDAGFALSTMGLLVTLALARHAAVWLPRGLLNLLDNDRLYSRDPTQMGGSWLPAKGREERLNEMASELPAWQRAWHYGKLSTRVHWIGDARYESALVDRDDGGLLPRFEHCAAALDMRLVSSRGDAIAPLDECARDAVALVAALQPEPVMLLTLPENDGPPPLCALLGSLGFGVRCSTTPLSDNALDPARVPLEAYGADAAIIRIVAPMVLALPDMWDDQDDDPVDDVWRNACALWQPLTALKVAA